MVVYNMFSRQMHLLPLLIIIYYTNYYTLLIIIYKEYIFETISEIYTNDL